jgi:tetratricopeptide (TPR) repeat protein
MSSTGSLLLGGLWLLASAPSAEGAAALDPKYLELLRSYAAGQRAEAVADLGQWGERALQSQLSAVQDARTASERCPQCPNPLANVPLRAAAMLHTDRDEAERAEPIGREQLARCPGMHARIAGRYAAILSRDPETRDFARRLFLLRAQRWQLGACFEDAHAAARAGLERFPRDAELLLTAGSVLEERAALTTVEGTEAVKVRQDWLKEARRDLTDAVSIDPDLVLARVRLGRILWRLGQPEAARDALEAAATRARDPREAYLAHLFLGRVYEDAERLDLALAEYRRAVDIHSEAQSAAVALSHALQLVGEAEESRRALARGLVDRPTRRDAYWDYLVTNARRADDLLADLHREAGE